MRQNRFKKYLGFIKAGMLDVFSYKFSLYVWLIGDVLSLVIMCVLWFSIYSQSSETVINGFTYTEMISYVVFSRVVSQLAYCSRSFFLEGMDIRQGNIAINLTKPINYRNKLFANSIGLFFADFLMLFIPLGVIACLVIKFGIGGELPHWYNILFFLVSVFLSMGIMDSFEFLIGQSAFVTGSIFGIMIIKDTILNFLSGGMIPLSFFPEWAQMALRILPFSSLLETPTFMLINAYTPMDAFIRICIQLGHFVLMYLICLLVNRRMVAHVVSVGG